MRIVIVGLGVQGKKRRDCAGRDVFATVDPVQPANYQDIRKVPVDQYDAACICTPDADKPEIIKYLLERGKHILVEKPLVGRRDQLREFEEFARIHNLTCYTAYNHRFEPHLIRLKAMLRRQILGDIYIARFCYANGTAQEVLASPWRDRASGALADLGSHLLDLSAFLLGRSEIELECSLLSHLETKGVSHVVFRTNSQPDLEFQASYVSWKNTFVIDVVGAKGSAHMTGLCKWGASSLQLCQRVFSSGKPLENTLTITCPDPTWAIEYKYFKLLTEKRYSNLANDVLIMSALEHIYLPVHH